jgi:hypothetical protein
MKKQSTIGSGPLNQARQLLVDWETGKVSPFKASSTGDRVRKMVANAGEPISALDFFNNDAAAAEARIKAAASITERPFLSLFQNMGMITVGEKETLKAAKYAEHFGLSTKVKIGSYSSPASMKLMETIRPPKTHIEMNAVMLGTMIALKELSIPTITRMPFPSRR